MSDHVRLQKATPKNKHRVRVFMDSGVFSAWSLQKPLVLKDYISFLKRNQSWLWKYVGYDVMPGLRGERRTLEQVAQSAQQSYDNLQVMRDAGLNPIPVFHQGEEFKWLDRLLKDGHDYIGISTIKEWNAKESLNGVIKRGMGWLNDVFSLICDKQGRPLIKTHGFGITKPAWLINYPFFTVDSTTWAMSSGNGLIYVPFSGPDGKPNYMRAPGRFAVTGRQPKERFTISKPSAGKHTIGRNKGNGMKQLEVLGPEVYNYVRHYIEDVCGVSITEARYDPRARQKIILCYYKELERVFNNVRFKNHNLSGSGPHASVANNKPGQWPLTIVYATSMSANLTDSLLANNVTTQLLNYFDFVHNYKKEYQLQQYVETGVIPVQQRAQMRFTWGKQAYTSRRALNLHKRLLMEPPE